MWLYCGLHYMNSLIEFHVTGLAMEKPWQQDTDNFAYGKLLNQHFVSWWWFKMILL